MSDPQSYLAKLTQTLKALQKRAARDGENASPELARQLADHHTAIALTEQAIRGDLSETEWREGLQPLRLALDSRSETAASGVTIGDVGGNISGIIAGRDVIIYEGVKPVSVGELLAACQTQINGVLFEVRHKYEAGLYVNRAIETDLNHFFDAPAEATAPHCFLLVAPAGSGKTNLLCDLARVRAGRQPVLLLLGGNTYLGGTTGLLGAIQAELEAADAAVAFRSAGDCLHTLHRLAEETDREALIFLDAINEHDRPAQMHKAVEDLLRKTRRRRIKLVITCRDYYWGLFKGHFWEGATINALPPDGRDDDEVEDGDDVQEDFSRFAPAEHDRALALYLDHYQITGRPIGDAAEQCRHPLLLRFFCEAYRGQEVGDVKHIRLKELFDHYWAQKLDSIADRMLSQGDERLQEGLTADVGDYLLKVAAHMLHHNARAIPRADIPQVAGRREEQSNPRSIYGRIRDEFIILEEKEVGKKRRKMLQVAFVYEEFMEYVMARALLRDWDEADLDETAILAEIEILTDKYDDFVQILGVIIYLALMLKEERDLALWSLLLDQGERWQTVVLEAMRKLPEDQLDAKVFEPLAELLTSGDKDIQKQVLDLLKVKRLGQAAPTAVVLLVRDLARHKQEAIARRAILALGHMPPELTLPIFVKVMDDDSTKKAVRQNVTTVLSRLKNVAVKPLLDELKSPVSNVRRGVAAVLEGLNWKPSNDKDMAWYLVTKQDWAECIRLGSPAVEPLIQTLKDTDETMRKKAAEALGQLGDLRAVKPLIEALKDRGRDVRKKAAEALGQLGDLRAVKPLIEALRDKDRNVREAAAEALGQLEDLRVVEPLIEALKDEDWVVRGKAAEVLGRLGNSQAVEPLIEALRDEDSGVRRRATKALGQVGDRRAVKPLIKALTDRDWVVRRKAAEVLNMLGWAPPEEHLAQYLVTKQDWAECIQLGSPAVEPLIEALKDKNWTGTESVGEAAAKALGQIGDRRAVGPLIKALKDKNKNIRGKAAEALGHLQDLRAIEPLIKARKDKDKSVRREVATALKKLGWEPSDEEH